MGNPQEAVKSYNEALALQREIGDKSGTSLTLINLGDLLNEGLGRPDEALPLLPGGAVAHARSRAIAAGEALALNNIGVAYLAKGEFSEAQTYFERALDIREQQKVPQEMADTLHNLGETLSRMGKYDQALTRYLSALDARRAAGDTRTAAMESYSIGTIFDYQGRYGAAAKSKGEALQAFREPEAARRLARRDPERRRLQPRAQRSRRRGLEEPRRGARGGARVEELEPRCAGPPVPGGERVLQGRRERRGPHSADEAVQAASRASDRSMDLWARFVAANISAAAQPTKAGGRHARADRPAARRPPAWPICPCTARCSRPTPCSGAATTSRRACWRKRRWRGPRRWGFVSCGREASTSSPPRCDLAETRRPAGTTRPRCNSSRRWRERTAARSSSSAPT